MTLNDAVTQLGNSIINLINKKIANVDVKATLIPNNTDLSTLRTPGKVYYGTPDGTYAFDGSNLPKDVAGKGFSLYVLDTGCTDNTFNIMQVLYVEGIPNLVYTRTIKNDPGYLVTVSWSKIAYFNDIYGAQIYQKDLNDVHEVGTSFYYAYDNHSCTNVPESATSTGFALQVSMTDYHNYVQTCTLVNGDMYRRVGTWDYKVMTWTPWNKLNTDGGSGGSTGIPTGGTAGQLLCKVDGTDYNTEWTGTSIVIENWED